AGAHDVADDTIDRGALRNGHFCLRNRVRPGDLDRRAAEKMQNADAAVPAFTTDLYEACCRALEPGRHHPAIVVPYGAKALPIAGVAPQRPVLDDLADGEPIKDPIHNRFLAVLGMTKQTPSQMSFAWVLHVGELVELDVDERSANFLDAPNVDGLHDIAGVGVDHDRTARTGDLHALECSHQCIGIG